MGFLIGMSGVLADQGVDELLVANMFALRNFVGNTLQTYPTYRRMTDDEAKAAIEKVNAWAKTKMSVFDAFKSKGGVLPAELVLQLSSKDAQDYFTAVYIFAASGSGLYETNAVADAISSGQWTAKFVNDDLAQRIAYLQGIAASIQDGTLAKVYLGDGLVAQSGLGSPVVIPAWLVVVGGLGAIALIFFVLYSFADRLMRFYEFSKQCNRAQAQGDQEALAKCLDSVTPPKETKSVNEMVGDAVRTVIIGATIIGLVYVGGVYVFPSILKEERP